MRRASLARVARVAARHQDAELDAEVRHLGVPVAELRSEVEAVNRLCRGAGAFTVEARVAAVARDLGMPAEELRSEVERLGEAMDATA